MAEIFDGSVEDEYMTIKKAAAYVGVTTTTLRNWDRQHKFKPARHPINGYRVYSRRDLEKVLAALRMPASVSTIERE